MMKCGARDETSRIDPVSSSEALLLQEVDVGAAEVFVGPPEGGGLGAGKGALGEVAHEALLVEHGACAAHEGEVAGDVEVVVDVGQTHVEQGAVVAGVGVVSVGELGAVESGVDSTQNQRGVGGQLEAQRRRVATQTKAGKGGGHAHQHSNCLKEILSLQIVYDLMERISY